ncbi:four helix bundle protein [Candidatus Falkowbacteria bacterium]|jgi:four helix bundle protein|nr:four helix bundle protein [Candidatus Falkowbacteria bacterium]MBT5503072.1 four helix bundle protein [Candidatus Falkowbacteria bacterium]MBT6573917.1 four helix bundle protein [Candidatus Falkowbacteria bacterium]MBT7348328.1 four helix bundle protein [Candidatus Falkowbacteria bacterium]MBT7500289.1 four helix bundle protein [Candidatus Falkowbacteria bacterium]
MAKSFSELRIWQQGHELLIEIYEITKGFPSWEKFCLIQQLIRAANSVIANIAESQGRYFFKDKVRVLYISRGELEEVRSHLCVAMSLKYISEEKWKHLDDSYQGLLVGLNSYINNLKSQLTN